MNCHPFQKRLVELLDPHLDPAAVSQLLEHARSCPQCAQEMESLQQTLAALQPPRRLAASPDFKERVMKDIYEMENGAARSAEHHPHRPRLLRPAFAMGFFALLIAATLLTTWFKGGTLAYALDQTIAAYQGVRFIHMQFEPASFGHVREMWAQFDEKGSLVHLRYDFPDTEDGAKVVVWQADKALVWFKSKKGSCVIREKNILDKMKMPIIAFDPKLLVEALHQKQVQGLAQVETRQPTAEGEPITLIVTSKDTPGIREVYKVDPKAKLVLEIEKYQAKNGTEELLGRTKYLDYNSPSGPEVFNLQIPADVTRVDETTQMIGLPQGVLPDKVIATDVVREFFTALIKKDYAKAGQMYGGMPAAFMQNSFGKMNFIRIISIGDPTPFAKNQSLRVPCKVEVEINGKKDVFEPYGPFVRRVYSQRDRWAICGGI